MNLTSQLALLQGNISCISCYINPPRFFLFFLVVRVGKFLGSTWSEAGWVSSSVHKKLATWRSSLKFHPPSIAHLQRCPPVSPPPCRDFIEKVDLKKNQRYENNKRELRPIQGVEIRWHLAVWDLEQSKSHKLIIIKNVCQVWPDMLLQSDGFAPPCKCPKSSPEALLLTWVIESPNITNRFNRGFWPFINSPKMDLKKPSRLRVES